VSSILPFEMNDETLRKKIAQVVADSSRMKLSWHARRRMRSRRISPRQVLETLRYGYVVEHAHRNVKGHWQCTLQHRTGGDEVRVVAALIASGEESVVVITVMR
jgi:hypothetical protein